MASYNVREGDKAFRRVNVRNAANPAFENVEAPGQVINYPDSMVVLEVLHTDGSRELIYEGPKGLANYVHAGADKIRLERTVPTERLWVRPADGKGIAYKVPSNLPTAEGIEFQIPAGVQKMELYGDEYFSKVFELR